MADPGLQIIVDNFVYYIIFILKTLRLFVDRHNYKAGGVFLSNVIRGSLPEVKYEDFNCS